MKKAFIVIGLGYGDEGKGLSTDYLCRTIKNPIVIRFNGGHQAGHTVVTGNGQRHVFSNFGAGTFRGCPTYWSRYCTFSPSYLLFEVKELGLIPKLYVDAYCPVTTHYDILFNRAIESTRGIQRLGSCGMGFGATVDRHFKDFVRLYVSDLLKPVIYMQKLKAIRSYYMQKMERETKFRFADFNHDAEDIVFNEYVEKIHTFFSKNDFVLTSEDKLFSNPTWDNYIFEGAQGVLLDQEFGFKPFITKSNTTSKNAIKILSDNLKSSSLDINVYYVTRCYLTRHGYGPFMQMGDEYKLKNTELETNIFNEFQGEFKVGYLNIDLLNYAIKCDQKFSSGANTNIIVTCLDQLPTENIKYFLKGKLNEESPNKLASHIECKVNDTLYSYHPCSDNLIF